MDAIVIGAGPAGLAVGACLQRAGVPFLILEQADGVGATWHGHYDRLHLHTPKSLSALPYLPFPKSYPRYPSRAQMIAYLEEYADHFGLQPRFGQHVLSARPAAGGWEVQTQETTFHAPNLVIATGNARVPYSPQWPGQADFRGTCLHSSAYRDGEPFRQRRVLVVGFGNSGGEIALDLCEHGAQTSMAVRSPVNVVPREVLGVPNVAITIAQTGLPPRVADALNAPILRLRFGDLTRYGLRRPPRGPLAQIDNDRRIPLIDIGTIQLIKRGQIQVYPGIERFVPDGVVFTDGRRQPFDAVVLATGYRPHVDAFLEGAAGALDDGERAVMPAFGAYAGGLSIRDRAFTKIFGAPDFTAHVLGDNRLHAIVASRCY